MMRSKLHLVVHLVLDLSFLILALCNLPAVFDRARIPFIAERRNDTVTIARVIYHEACPGLKEGDKILFWNHYEIESVNELEFLSDLSSIGERIAFQFERGGSTRTAEVTLIPFYESLRFVIVMTIVGFIIWCMAVFVAFNRLDGPAAYSLHWALVGLAIAMLLTQGKISLTNLYSIISRVGLLTSYLLTAVLFYFFTTIYPHNKLGSIGLKASLIFLPTVTFTAVTIYFFIEAIQYPFTVESYLQVYNIYHIVLAIFAVCIIVSIVDSYMRAQSTEDRSRLQWILWGVVIGQTPFLLFIIVPQILLSRDWIPEEYATVFFLATPFSFAVSFVKYRLLDVEVMINRSIVYTLLTLFIGLMYALVVILGTSFIGGEIVFTKYLVVLLIAFVIAWLLNPLRLRLQRVIDEALFPTRVHYSRIIAHLTEKMHKSLSVNELARYVIESCIEVIPISSIAFYMIENEILVCRHSHGRIQKAQIGISSDFLKQIRSGHFVVSFPTQRGSEEQRDALDSEWLKGIGFALCIPIISESGNMHGMIAASPRSEGERFTWEEIELFKNIAAQVSEVLERLLLQKKVILEQEERQKVEELNQLKSYFVTSVSHELRTPLTSICMFAETLRHGNIRSEKKRREYIKIIDQETQRLSRLIDNVLNFSRVERGVKEYTMDSTDVAQVLKKAVTAMEYQFEKYGVKLHISMPKALPRIHADGDALEEAVINLLSNAVKYSGSKKEVDLKVLHSKKGLAIQVADKGIGIPEQELTTIFNPYHRVKGASHIRGMGLGLSLVKHIVEAHRGTIEVQSKFGKGSRFIICLPLTQKINSKRQ